MQSSAFLLTNKEWLHEHANRDIADGNISSLASPRGAGWQGKTASKRKVKVETMSLDKKKEEKKRGQGAQCRWNDFSR